jgi:hypothetical protein
MAEDDVSDSTQAAQTSRMPEAVLSDSTQAAKNSRMVELIYSRGPKGLKTQECLIYWIGFMHDLSERS